MRDYESETVVAGSVVREKGVDTRAGGVEQNLKYRV